MVCFVKILKEWKNEACVKYPTLFKYNRTDNELIIYTSRPGLYIGVHGKLVDKYTKILQKEYPELKAVKFVETAPYTV